MQSWKRCGTGGLRAILEQILWSSVTWDQVSVTCSYISFMLLLSHECYFYPDEPGFSSKSLLTLSETLASLSRVNDQLLAKEEKMVQLETNLYFELQGISFNCNKSFILPWSQDRTELLLGKQKILQQLEKELKLSSLRFSSLVQWKQQLEEASEQNRQRLHPELERELKQSSFQLLRLVQGDQELKHLEQGDNVHLKGSNLNQQHREEIDKDHMERLQIVIQSGLNCEDSRFLKEEDEISQSSLQLASLMENSLSVEDESGGEDGDRRQLRSEVIEENGLMTGKDSWRSRGDDHECGNDAWLMMDTGCNSAHQVSLTLNQGGEPLLDPKPQSPPLK